MPKRRPVNVEGESPSRPFDVIQWAGAGVLGCMIVYNAFFGQALRVDKLVMVPKGASTHVEVAAPVSTPKTIVLKYDENIENAQRQMLATGHYKGLVDGITGAQTRLAVKAYQTDNALPVSGEVTKALLAHMQTFRKRGLTSIKSLPQSTAQPANPAILKVEKYLVAMGYNPGAVDGIKTEDTKAAILKFEMDQNMDMTGEVTSLLLSSLVKARGDQAASAN
jgi:peptidoglycan hydrolase-like protein with peptidoglycan-binding domain